MPGSRAARISVAIALVALVALGAVLRGHVAANPSPPHATDERAYLTLGRDIADNGRYGGGTSLHDAFHWAPGAPALFAAARLADPPQHHAQLAPGGIYVAQAIVGSLVIIGAFALAALEGGAIAGLVAAAAVALYPPLIRATGHALSEPLGALGVTTGLALLAAGLRRPAPWRLAAAGAVLGLAALTRADLLAGIALLMALVVVARRSAGPRAAFTAAAITATAAAVVIGAYAVPASIHAGRLVPISSAGDSALYVGTYLPGHGTLFGFKRAMAPQYRRRHPELRHVKLVRLREELMLDLVAARHPGKPRGQALRAAAWHDIGRYLTHRPAAFASMLLGKAARMWTRPTTGTRRQATTTDLAVHRVLLLAAALGLLLGAGLARRSGFAAIVVVIAASTAVSTVYLSEPRHALPLIPVLIAGGAAGWAEAARRLSRAYRSTRVTSAGDRSRRAWPVSPQTSRTAPVAPGPDPRATRSP